MILFVCSLVPHFGFSVVFDLLVHCCFGKAFYSFACWVQMASHGIGHVWRRRTVCLPGSCALGGELASRSVKNCWFHALMGRALTRRTRGR